jgi:hypothetical protein
MNKTQQFEQYLILNIPISNSKWLDSCYCNYILYLYFIISFYYFVDETEKALYVKEIINGRYEIVLNNEFFLSTVIPLINENIEENIKISNDNYKNWFYVGVASFLYFIQNNWTGPVIKEDIDCLLTLRKLASTHLSVHDQYNENVVKPELLYFAKIILQNDQLHQNLPSSMWWLFRANYIHQLILEEASEILFEKSENLIKKISITDLIKKDSLKALFNIEVAQFYFYYTRIQSSENFLEEAIATAKLSLNLEGALGKRTKYQQKEKAQLFLNAKVDKDLFLYRVCDVLPKVINLSDDVRLEKVEFSEKRENMELGSIEEAIIMAKL